jgi:hypothetical protein
MTIQYEIKETESGDIIIRHNEDGTISSFLAHPANSDYQAYLDRDKPKAALSTPSV